MNRVHHTGPAALLGAAALVTASLATGSTASAAGSPATGVGQAGQRLTVSATAGLDPEGETIRVTGEKYDATKGIYVALCKDNGDDRIPGPCLGGADTSGGASASKWIVPKGDPNEGELALAYGDGGTFDVELALKAKDTNVDCTQVACSVVTRVDHRGTGDRSQDVRVPVAFAGTTPGDGEGVDVPAGTVSYVRTAEFTTAGRPQDLLLHPDSGKLYVGSADIPDTADVNERGLYALDPADGRVLSHVAQAPGSTGALAARNVPLLIAPLAGDGVVFHYPLRGIGTAKDGDTAAQGVWLTGATVTGAGPGTDASTVLVAQGPALSEIETATGAVRRTVTLDGGSALGVDGAHGAAWSAGATGGLLRRVDTGSFTVTATAQLPDGYVTFLEADPATGNIWVGSGTSVLVLDRDARLLATLEGQDRPTAAAFDTATGEAFVLREDYGNADNGADNVGSLEVYDTSTFQPAAEPVALPGNRADAYAGVAVTPGGGSVYVTDQAESKVVRLDRRMSPKVARSPADQSVAPGEEVTFTATAEGTPEPTVRWQVSTDAGQTWSAVEGATDTTYSFTALASHDGHRYRAEFTNSAGTTRTAPVTLTVTEAGGGETGGDDSGGVTGGEDSGGTDPGESGGTTGGDSGTAASGGTGSGTAATGGTGSETTGGSDVSPSGTAGTGTEATDTSATSGSLAATGVGALSVAALAAALTGAGWAAYRRGRSVN
ncbi:hypothetical protein ABZ848_31890 [Streptomyces sp. NPDC047081]|uniref:hypothetical protein n=1 Tax=Streptomyces sp. NPDC047081 TaxID=3154706 RepID=UPI0033E7208F